MKSYKLKSTRALEIAILDSRLTQREIAKRAEINETRLSRILRGEQNIYPDERKRIASVLLRRTEDLFPEMLAS